MLATASDADVNVLFLILALLSFAAGIYLVAARRDVVAALVAAFVGVLILVFAV